MEENEGIITFDFIWKCWKEESYPDGFDNLLTKYLDIKREIFSNATPPENITSWLSRTLVAIEIGIRRDEKRFKPYKDYWMTLLGREWIVSIEDKWVVWKNE